MEQLPSPEHVRKLIERLSRSKLVKATEGLINDTVKAHKNQDMLEAICALNSWIATLEELGFEGRRLQYIIKARESRNRNEQST